MEAALAELSIEDVKDEADDIDFIVIKGKYFILLIPSHSFSQTRRMFSNLTLKVRTRRRKQCSKPLRLEKDK